MESSKSRLTDPEGVNSAGKPSKPKFSAPTGYFWGGIPKPLFWVLLPIAIFVVFLAIMLPIFLGPLGQFYARNNALDIRFNATSSTITEWRILNDEYSSADVSDVLVENEYNFTSVQTIPIRTKNLENIWKTSTFQSVHTMHIRDIFMYFYGSMRPTTAKVTYLRRELGTVDFPAIEFKSGSEMTIENFTLNWNITNPLLALMAFHFSTGGIGANMYLHGEAEWEQSILGVKFMYKTPYTHRFILKKLILADPFIQQVKDMQRTSLNITEIAIQILTLLPDELETKIRDFLEDLPEKARDKVTEFIGGFCAQSEEEWALLLSNVFLLLDFPATGLVYNAAIYALHYVCAIVGRENCRDYWELSEADPINYPSLPEKNSTNAFTTCILKNMNHLTLPNAAVAPLNQECRARCYKESTCGAVRVSSSLCTWGNSTAPVSKSCQPDPVIVPTSGCLSCCKNPTCQEWGELYLSSCSTNALNTANSATTCNPYSYGDCVSKCCAVQYTCEEYMGEADSCPYPIEDKTTKCTPRTPGDCDLTCCGGKYMTCRTYAPFSNCLFPIKNNQTCSIHPGGENSCETLCCDPSSPLTCQAFADASKCAKALNANTNCTQLENGDLVQCTVDLCCADVQCASWVGNQARCPENLGLDYAALTHAHKLIADLDSDCCAGYTCSSYRHMKNHTCNINAADVDIGCQAANCATKCCH